MMTFAQDDLAYKQRIRKEWWHPFGAGDELKEALDAE